MKTMTLIAGLLFSASSFACPEIQGIFQSENGSANFETTVQDGVYTYHINGNSFVADAQQHHDSNANFTTNYTANCHDNKWFLTSTIFQKDTKNIQVGSGVFTKTDDETLTYDFSVTLYSPQGDAINAMPGHVVFKLQPPSK